MAKIAFIGAGSTVFAKNVLGDILRTPAFADAQLALFDIDAARLEESRQMLENIAACYKKDKLRITATTRRADALRSANYVINAAQIGGFEPCGVRDLEIPKKYGMLQTVGDTLGVGGIFRTLRTVPVLLEIHAEMEKLCPDAWFINYANPMASITGTLYKASPIKTIGICHSVQECIPELFTLLDIPQKDVSCKIAGINHMAWLLEVTRKGEDLYPLIQQKAAALPSPHDDMVRFEIMRRFGYYSTESSRHAAEYMPYFIKRLYPNLVQELNIPIDSYIINTRKRIKKWAAMKQELVDNPEQQHQRTKEYASYIVEALETGQPYCFNGNVMNTDLIPNLPKEAVVEVPCVVDSSGILPCHVGPLPAHLAALNQTNINPQLLTIQAALSHKKQDVYHAAMLDPRLASELSLDDITALCDEMIEAHGNWLPTLR